MELSQFLTWKRIISQAQINPIIGQNPKSATSQNWENYNQIENPQNKLN